MGDILVVGGGIAGLSAGVYLAAWGHRVTIVERSPALGGRIRSVRPHPDSEPIDWGQHLLIGAYHETLRLTEIIGTRNHLKTVQGATPFVEPGGIVHRYRIGRFPSPFHTLPGILALGHLSLSERLFLGKVAWAAWHDLSKDPEGLDRITAREWLIRNGQSECVIERFWEMLIVSTLNTPSHEASAFLFAVVLARGIFGPRSDALPILPETTLSAALVEPAATFVSGSGGLILTGRRALRLIHEKDRCTGIRDDEGTVYRADAVILATAPWHLLPLCEGRPELSDLAERSNRFIPSPILSIDLWFNDPCFSFPMCAMVRGAFHWAFSHSRAEKAGHRVSLVLSAAENLFREPNEHLLTLARSELRRYFPHLGDPCPTTSFVIREPRATFRALPHLERYRPASETSLRGLFLAGDWTSTGLPATIEGAVLSGHRAAVAAHRFLMPRVDKEH